MARLDPVQPQFSSVPVSTVQLDTDSRPTCRDRLAASSQPIGGGVTWPSRSDLLNVDLLQFRRRPFFSGLLCDFDNLIHVRPPLDLRADMV